jgi:hypothetical protein
MRLSQDRFFLMRLFKVAAGKPIWATVHKSGHPRASRREFCRRFFSSFYWVRKTPGAPPGIISDTSGHLGRITDLP